MILRRAAAWLPRSLTFATALAAMSAWQLLVTGALTVAVFATLTGLLVLFFVYGSAFRRVTSGLVTTSGSAYELLTGFFIVNTALFALALATPVGAGGWVAVLGVGAIVLLPWLRREHRSDVRTDAVEWASLACIVLCGIAATLWTSDLHPLEQVADDRTIFRATRDVFIHAREISAFASSHGVASVGDIRAVGSTAPLYHFAGYMVPAVLTALTGTSALSAYASVQLPFGIVLTGLGAFVLGRPLFGTWASLAAAVAVVMLPDPYQQGLGIRLLGYHFMSQVNLGMLYGIACVCVAWLFVVEGCRRRTLSAVVIGYTVLLCCLGYKAHLFVANAYPLLIFPCLFFGGVRARWRLVVGIVSTTIFVAAVVVAQHNQRVPLMRLDGSGLMGYAYELLGASDPSPLRAFFDGVLTDGGQPDIVLRTTAAAMIALATFGPWLVIGGGVAWARRRRWATAVIGLPILVVANYFVMSLGLALDSRAIGAPEELLNRPFAWAYFVVVVWSVAGLWQLAFRHGLPQRVSTRMAIFACLLACIGSVVVESRKLQTFPAWDGFADYADFNAAPDCFVQAGRHLRTHAAAGDVIQDAENDRDFMLTAIAERQAYAIDAAFGGASPTLAARLAALASVEKSGDDAALLAFMGDNGIAWYLVHPRPSIAVAVPHRPAAFSCGGYRLLHRSSGARP